MKSIYIAAQDLLNRVEELERADLVQLESAELSPQAFKVEKARIDDQYKLWKDALIDMIRTHS